ncbi:hypothetical protein B0T16DRAFT_498669 [Cercophora newfieldiana]|uniref:Uncharacterized protein n=1 Tax=Cercophora newfieldiana TaxID=92897 RepID=A0AA39YM66_9PEZI|nr:hypothetical protein B0T16DRAFT_498669 [Cercophora newfieldiana]
MLGCVGATPGLLELYILEMTLPACQAKIRVGYYGMCAYHEKLYACASVKYWSKPDEVQGLFEEHITSTAACSTRQAIQAALMFQFKIIQCIQVGGAVLFLLGVTISVVWAMVARWAWEKRRVVYQSKQDRGGELDLGWESEVRECYRALWWPPKLQAAIWTIFAASAVVSLISTLSVWQNASGLAYSHEMFGQTPITIGRKLPLLQGIALVLLVVFLAILWAYCLTAKRAAWRLVLGDPDDSLQEGEYAITVSELKGYIDKIERNKKSQGWGDTIRNWGNRAIRL